MRRNLARLLGYWQFLGKDGDAWTTTTNIGAAATVTSTELRDAGFDDYGSAGTGDDVLDNLWIYILGTNNANIARRVARYDASAGQLTVSGTDLAAESGSVDFELHRYSPYYLRDKLNDARQQVSRTLYLPRMRYVATAQHQHYYDVPSAIIGKPSRIWLVKDIGDNFANNILSNGDMETWTLTTVPDSWTLESGLTAAEETSTTSPYNYATWEGSSARLTNGTTGTARRFYQAISSPGTHSGQRINLLLWVYCRTAGIVRTSITIDSTEHIGTDIDGGIHGGTGWELLTHYEDSLDTLTTLEVGLSLISTAGTGVEFYAGKAICVVGPGDNPSLKDELLENWEYMPLMQDTTLRQHVRFEGTFPDNRLLRFEGRGELSSVSAETDTMEIAKPEADYLYNWAAKLILEEQYASTTDSDRAYITTLLNNVQRNLGDFTFSDYKQPRVKLKIPDA